MACNLEANCNFLYGFFSCTLPEDTINVDITVCTLKGIHIFKKHRNIQVIKCSAWTSKIKPFWSLQCKRAEYLRQREATNNPFANSSNHSRMKPSPFVKRPKAIPTRICPLVTGPNVEKLSKQGRLTWGTILNFCIRIGSLQSKPRK